MPRVAYAKVLMGRHAILSGKDSKTTQKNLCVKGSVTRNMEYLVGKGGAVKLIAEQEGRYPASNQDLYI